MRSLKDKDDYKFVLSIEEIVLVVHCTLVKSSVMQKLVETNIRSNQKFRTIEKNFKTILTTVLQGVLFKMLQKILKPGRTYSHCILLQENLILTNKRSLKDRFYLERMLYRAIYDIIQTPQEEMRFSSFHFVALLLIDHDY